MIKLHSKGTAPDYTEHGSVTTNCMTVGQFMTEAAAIYGGGLVIEVDCCRYKFDGHQKISVTDNTPIEEITYTSVPGSITFILKTKPKPNTVKKSGWVNIYRDREDEKQRYVGTRIFPSEYAANAPLSLLNRVSVAQIEWEEAEK